MDRAFRYGWWVLTRACVGLWVAAVAIGCHSACKDGSGHKVKHSKHPNAHIDNCSDIEQGAIPLPVGTFSGEYWNRQAIKAEADDFVIYYNEWIDGQSTTNQYGADHLARIAARLPVTPFLVVVQPEPGQNVLSMARRDVVVNTLLKAGIADAPNRVVLGRPTAEGLFGEEAERIYPQLVRGGFNGFGGGFNGIGGGGFGGFGFGGGGFGGGFGGGGFGGGFGISGFR